MRIIIRKNPEWLKMTQNTTLQLNIAKRLFLGFLGFLFFKPLEDDEANEVG